MSIPLKVTTQSLIRAARMRNDDAKDQLDCGFFSIRFGEDKNAHKESDAALAAASELLGSVTSFWLDWEKPHEPFGPMFVMNGHRSGIPGDISEEHLSVLSECLAEIEDPELSARIADILWLRNRQHSHAEMAVRSYVASARRCFENGIRNSGITNVKRAVGLGAMLGKNQELYSWVIKQVELILGEKVCDFSYVAAPLLEVLQEQGFEISSELKTRLQEIIENSNSDLNPQNATRRLLSCLATDYARSKDVEALKETRTRIAETWEEDAENALRRERPSHMVAAQFLSQSIQAHRLAGSDRGRIEEIHKRLLEYQGKMESEMGTISTEPVNVTEYIEKAISSVKGKEKTEALVRLALCARPLQLKTIRDNEAEGNKSLMDTVTAISLGSTGKVVARNSGIPGESSARSSIRMGSDSVTLCQIQRCLMSSTQINPMREQIHREHRVTIQDFRSLTDYNPIVPEGRESLWAKGLWHGMNGDFVESTHILIPQLEHSLREILVQHGHLASSLDASGIQKENNLNQILEREELESIIGEDLVFDLQTLLVDPGVSNLRNEVSHGMLDEGALESDRTVYLWWLCLHFCYMALVSASASGREE